MPQTIVVCVPAQNAKRKVCKLGYHFLSAKFLLVSLSRCLCVCVCAPSILTFCLARKNLPFSDRRQPSTTRLPGARDLILVAIARLQFHANGKLGQRTQQVCPFCCCSVVRTRMRYPSKSNSGSFSRRRLTKYKRIEARENSAHLTLGDHNCS